MTTPDPVLLQRRFRELVDAGVRSCAIEASSIGIAERRLDGTAIRVAVFTNFTQDHLDYHGSMQAYWQAKAALFDWPGLRAAVIQADDPRAGELVAKAQARFFWATCPGQSVCTTRAPKDRATSTVPSVEQSSITRISYETGTSATAFMITSKVPVTFFSSLRQGTKNVISAEGAVSFSMDRLPSIGRKCSAQQQGHCTGVRP